MEIPTKDGGNLIRLYPYLGLINALWKGELVFSRDELPNWLSNPKWSELSTQTYTQLGTESAGYINVFLCIYAYNNNNLTKKKPWNWEGVQGAGEIWKRFYGGRKEKRGIIAMLIKKKRKKVWYWHWLVQLAEW